MIPGIVKLLESHGKARNLYKQAYKMHVIPADCRNPGSMDGLGLPSMALGTRFPAGMTSYLDICA